MWVLLFHDQYHVRIYGEMLLDDLSVNLSPKYSLADTVQKYEHDINKVEESSATQPLFMTGNGSI